MTRAENPVERRVTLLTLGLGLLLLAQLLLSGVRLAILSPPEPVLPAVDDVSAAQMLLAGAVSPADSAAIRERPLFSPSRRAPTAGGGVDAAAGGTPGKGRGSIGNIKLVGLFGAGKAAGIIATVGDSQRRVPQGGEIDGWTVETVSSNQVVLSRDGRRETLVLLPQGLAAGAAAPVTSGPAAAAAPPRPGRAPGAGAKVEAKAGAAAVPGSLGFGGAGGEKKDKE